MFRTVRFISRIRYSSVLAKGLTRQICSATVRHLETLQRINLPRDFSQKVHTPPEDTLMDANLYEFVCSDALEQLGDYFEEILENTNCLDSVPDVLYSDGVLTVKISNKHGTYVINRQSPNRQIWLSSPQSGPKRFDYVPSKDNEQVGKWVYKHSGEVLHELLQSELSPILTDVDLDFHQLIRG